MKNGVPYDVAFSLPPALRLAYAIAFGQFEGGKFDWGRMQWEERR